jgi:alpha-D-glucose phosphate-specific phosphoglucomutase
MGRISFGTDGWRDIIARDFTFANVELVAGGVARYINKHNLAGRGVVIGYDNRFLSERFAGIIARVFYDSGIRVYLMEKSTPTPVTAFAIKEYSAGGAVMLTASHNPPEYNGFKFIPEYAGPALPEVTNEIEMYINELERQGGLPRNQGENRGADSENANAKGGQVNLKASYFSHLQKLVDLSKIKQDGLKVVVDPMYGAGIGYLEEILSKAGAQVKALHNHRDPLFGGILPEPTGQSLAGLREQVLSSGADLGLALDGDADRFGIIDRDGNYISPNQFLAIVYYHQINFMGLLGPVARTVATTHMLDRIAAEAGQQVYETPVGFKFIGQNLRERDCLLGGEESGGLSIRGHIPEKDGILADLLAAQIVSYHRKSLGELLKEIWTRYGRLVSERMDIHTTQKEKERTLKALREFTPREVAGKKVVKRLGNDGTKLVLEDGSWLLVRASGTEPLFRVYAEAGGQEELKEIQEWGRALIG